MNLYNIEDALLQLSEARERAVEEGEVEAVVVIDAETEKYLSNEAVKVNSYAALIRKRASDAEILAEEASRLAARANAAAAHVKRLKETALRVMKTFRVTELKTPQNTLRRCGNGGLSPLEIDEHFDLGSENAPYQNATITMSRKQWMRLVHREMTEQEVSELERNLKITPDSEAIRKALAERVACPDCSSMARPLPDGCRRCTGAGTLPRTIPGVRLLPRGEHVRLL